MSEYSRGVSAALLMLATVSSCKRSPGPPDRDALPSDRDLWCCTTSGSCSAARRVDGFPECANLYWLNERKWGLTEHGHDDAGRFIGCDVTLRKARAIDPAVLGKTASTEQLPSGDGFSAEDVRSCLKAMDSQPRARKERVYFFTYFDKRDEQTTLGGGYTSKYYCDNDRAIVETFDWVEKLSGCEQTP